MKTFTKMDLYDDSDISGPSHDRANLMMHRPAANVIMSCLVRLKTNQALMNGQY